MSSVSNKAVAISAFAAGLLFGLGLIVSGMTNPAKVVGFLDLFGGWDPSLILVMGAGLAVTTPAFHIVLRRSQPLFEDKFYMPTAADISPRLMVGSALFGIGWGLAGLCPGPALTAITSLNTSVLLFVPSMIAGIYLHRMLME